MTHWPSGWAFADAEARHEESNRTLPCRTKQEESITTRLPCAPCSPPHTVCRGAPAAHRRAIQDTTLTSTATPQSGDPSPAPGPSADPYPAPDTTYLLRIAFDTGDLYIKALQKGAMRGMVRAAADPASKVHDFAQPQLPGGSGSSSSSSGSSSRRRVALGAREEGDRQQQARRLMQTATTVVVQNCPNCTEAADTVCRCLTGDDSRVPVSSKPVYPLRWVEEQTNAGCAPGGALYGC